MAKGRFPLYVFPCLKSVLVFDNSPKRLFRFVPIDNDACHSRSLHAKNVFTQLQSRMDLNCSIEERETPLLSTESNVMEGHEDINSEVNESPALQQEDTLLQLNAGAGAVEITINDNNDDDDDAWYRNPHQITAMISNFSTSYNVVNISLVLPILQQLQEKSSAADSAACASSLLAGMVIGQLGGGALGDSILGRLGALRVVMCLQIVASIASACLPIGTGNIYVNLALWRFILGVGAGGVYPLAAVLSAEQGAKSSSNNDGDQGKRVVLTFSTQGLGFVTVPLVAVPLLHITSDLNLIWRILLGLGSVPGIILMIMQWQLYARVHRRGAAIPLEEPTEERQDRNVTVATCVDPVHDETDDIRIQSDIVDVPRRLGWWESILQEPGLGRKIIGTAGTWCLFGKITIREFINFICFERL